MVMQHFYPKSEKLSGFSLAELSIILAILALVIGMSVSTGQMQLKMSRYNGTQNTLNSASEALELYYQKYQRYPCPALPNTAQAAANYGRAAATCYASCTAPTICPPNTSMAIGTLPYKDLGLPDNKGEDEWGNKITYIVDRELTTPFNDPFGSIPVFDSTGTTEVMQASGLGKAKYVVISHGENEHGAYRTDGSRITCDTVNAKLDSENCDDDGVIIDSFLNESDIDANDYDDLMVWKTSQDGSLPDRTAFHEHIRDIDMNRFNGCVIDSENRRWCWGDNQYGQMGIGVTNKCVGGAPQNDNSVGGYTVPIEGFAPNGDTVTQVKVGDGFTCTLTNESELYCMGDGFNIPDGSVTTDITLPKLVLSNVDQIATDRDHACAIKHDGSLWCWGQNNHGQLGVDLSITSASIPQLVDIDDVKQVDVGYRSTCALKHDGTVWCWGRTYYNGFGGSHPNAVSGSQMFVPSEITNPLTRNIQKIVNSGGGHACGLTDDRKVICWGRADNGAMGTGVTSYVREPDAQIVTSARHYANATTAAFNTIALNNVIDIEAGDAITCALKANGEMYCWGENDNQRLALSRYGATENFPVLINHANPVVKMIAGTHTTCSIDTLGALRCWGKNDRFVAAVATASTAACNGSTTVPNTSFNQIIIPDPS